VTTVTDETKDLHEDIPEIPTDDQTNGDAADVGADDLFAFDVDEPAAAEPVETIDEVADPAVADAGDEAVSEGAAPAAPTEAELLEEEKRRKGMRWYVIHANTGHENKVKRNIEMAIKANALEDVFGEILVATQDVTEMRNGRRVTSKRKFFPSYVLVEMVMSKETQHFINSIPGVTRFIGGTQVRPQPISRDEVDRILGRMNKTEEAGTLLEIPYQVGDSVQVVDGPFSDWVGVINEINHDKGKLKVMISIFGSETPVELDFLQVKDV
jgi:transcription termination/antitermination protein NusG